jgi:isoquinoline 1-oxidoreductase subunit alpha
MDLLSSPRRQLGGDFDTVAQPILPLFQPRDLRARRGVEHGGGMASKLKIKVNGLVHSVTATLDTPLLYVLHNELHLHGPRFGCGLAQCGACSVLLDGKEIRSCVTPVAAVSGKSITTLEGLPAMWAKERGTTSSAPSLHPLQQAWIEMQVPQCGYCQNGMIIQAADLLSTTKRPTEAQIKTAMNGHLCRCGTYTAIVEAIQRAAKSMTKGA